MQINRQHELIFISLKTHLGCRELGVTVCFRINIPTVRNSEVPLYTIYVVKHCSLDMLKIWDNTANISQLSLEGHRELGLISTSLIPHTVRSFKVPFIFIYISYRVWNYTLSYISYSKTRSGCFQRIDNNNSSLKCELGCRKLIISTPSTQSLIAFFYPLSAVYTAA